MRDLATSDAGASEIPQPVISSRISTLASGPSAEVTFGIVPGSYLPEPLTTSHQWKAPVVDCQVVVVNI